eukprot:1183555-Prorocentrum_minimum.AAC.1
MCRHDHHPTRVHLRPWASVSCPLWTSLPFDTWRVHGPLWAPVRSYSRRLIRPDAVPGRELVEVTPTSMAAGFPGNTSCPLGYPTTRPQGQGKTQGNEIFKHWGLLFFSRNVRLGLPGAHRMLMAF